MRRVVAATSAAALAVAALAGCSAGGGSSPPATTTAAAPTADPRAEQVRQLVARAAVELDVQAAVFGVWEGDGELVRGAFDAPGSATAPTSPDALVRVGQPMEAMLTTVLLQLVEEGVLGLDDPVERYLPELPGAAAITPRMLANTNSGTPDYIPDPAFQAALYADPFVAWTYEELLAFATATPRLYPPGTSWSYSHTDMASLGELVERATGQDLGRLLEERIFRPLGMDRARVVRTTELGAPAFHAFTSERGVYEESTSWNPTWALHSGNMNATVPELGRWARALGRGELLGAEAHQVQLGPGTVGLGPMTASRYFTFGVGVVGGWVVANPNLQGYRGLVAHRTDPEVTIVVYTTGTRADDGAGNDAVAIGQRISQLVVPGAPLSVGG